MIKKAKSVYENLPLGPLTADDIADDVIYVASRPEHVQVADLITFSTNQAGTEHVYRKQ